MKTNDSQHKKLIKLAGFHASNGCHVCARHEAFCAGRVPYKHINPNNLLKHLTAKHGYQPRKWWRFWK